MKIYYDSAFKCYLSPVTSVTPFIEVPEDFKLSKTIEFKLGSKQKLNEQGEPLFIEDVYETKTHEVVTGFSETIKSNIDGVDLEPVLVEVQKTDDDGNNLYYKVNDRGETEETLEETEYPVIVKVHKTNNMGKPLYKKPIVEIQEEQVKTGEREVTTNTGRPVMVDVVEDREVSIFNDPQEFTIQEVLKVKFDLLEAEYGSNIFYTECIDLDKIDSFNGNTGLGSVQIAPKSKLRFKTLTLKSECNTISLIDFRGDSRITMQVGGRSLNNTEVKLATNIKQMTITLVNNTEEYLEFNKLLLVASFKEQTQEEKLEARLTTIEENQARMQSVLDEMLLGGGI